MIQVGIQEDLRLINAVKNDQGTLVLTLRQGGGADILDMLSNGSTASENETGFYMWPIKPDDRLDSDALIVQDLVNKINVLKSQLNHILEQYKPMANYKWDITNGLNFADNNAFMDALLDPLMRKTVVDRVYTNFVDQFVREITPFLASPQAWRMKLLRTSKDKNFPTIPRFVPFIEPMSIPKTASKLKFSAWEMGYRKGDPEGQPSGTDLSDPTPAAGEAGGGNAAEAEAVANLFGVK
jgi:hypothetical protein